MIYDIIIVGSGPAASISAHILSSKGMSILMIEKGKNLDKRKEITSGWFGNHMFMGSKIPSSDLLDTSEAISFIKKISHPKPKLKSNFLEISNDFGINLAQYLFNSISENSTVLFESFVSSVSLENNIFSVKTSNNTYYSKKCLLATGLFSVNWLINLSKSLNFLTNIPKVKLGVRVEIPSFKYSENEETIDVKINSHVGEWDEFNVISAFGHFDNINSKTTNFLVGSDISLEEGVRFVKIVNVLANDKIKKERVKDYMEGKSILKYLNSFNLKPSFEKINSYIPNFINFATMHIPEIKLIGILSVDDNMRTNIPSLYGAGECTPKVSNFLGAFSSGIIAAKTILKE